MPLVEGSKQVRQSWSQPYAVKINDLWIGHSHSRTVNLIPGEKYTLTLTAPNGAAFVVPTGHTQGSGSYTLAGGGAQSSSDGKTWQNISPRYPENDILMLYTLEGGPKRLP